MFFCDILLLSRLSRRQDKLGQDELSKFYIAF